MKHQNISEFVTVKPVKAFRVTDDCYDGKECLCAFALKHNIYISDKIAKAYGNPQNFDCEYCDDTYCMNKKNCKHKVMLGYIVQNTPIYRTIHPVIGDYVVVDENGTLKIVEAEKFEKTYCLMSEATQSKISEIFTTIKEN